MTNVDGSRFTYEEGVYYRPGTYKVKPQFAKALILLQLRQRFLENEEE